MNISKKKQITIINQLKEFDSAPMNTAAIKNILDSYGYPNNKIASLADEGYLIRLKRGLYAVSPETGASSLHKFVISNNMYGPSYISYQSALYYYGLIPEAVPATTAVTFKRSKLYHTTVGTFKYYHVPSDYYSIGSTIVTDGRASYIIAMKEKALCDLVIFNRNFKIQSKKAMAIFLEEDMRVDMDGLTAFDTDIIDACLDTGLKWKELKLLKEIVNGCK